MRRLPLAVRFAALAALCLVAAGPLHAAAKPMQAQPAHHDPYKNFKFRLEIAGRTVAGLNKVNVPAATADIVKRSGGDPSTSHKSPGRSKYEAITLERGVTEDSDFANWASSGPKSNGRAQREVQLVALDEKGDPVRTYRIHRAWVSEYQAVPNLDAGANAIAIQHIKLENEGWEQ
jgi:phage tail-like protein